MKLSLKMNTFINLKHRIALFLVVNYMYYSFRRSEVATEVDFEDDELPVQGPLPLEPDDAPWKKSESGIRKLLVFVAFAVYEYLYCIFFRIPINQLLIFTLFSDFEKYLLNNLSIPLKEFRFQYSLQKLRHLHLLQHLFYNKTCFCVPFIYFISPRLLFI